MCSSELYSPNTFQTTSEGGFDLNRNQNDNFAVFSHEEDPEEWVNEITDWCSFETWLIKLVESEGEDDLP